jgi:hypothetical protein
MSINKIENTYTSDAGGNESTGLYRPFDDFENLIIIYDRENISNDIGYQEIKIKVIPDVVSYSYQPNFQSAQILGRFSPIYLYSNGSDETFSFSMTLHEDLLPIEYASLEEFVNLLKSLSYPRVKSNMALIFPRVYFQIGELVGFGVVTTSVTWKKPIRDGRYILADISISINIEERLKSPAVKQTGATYETEGLDKTNNIYYNDQIIKENFQYYYNYIYEPSDYLTNKFRDDNAIMTPLFNYNDIFGSKYSDIFESKYSEEITGKERTAALTQLRFDYTRLQSLFATFEEVNETAANNMKSISNELEKFKKLSGVKGEDFFASLIESQTAVLGINFSEDNYLLGLSNSSLMKEVEAFIDVYIEGNLYTRFGGSEEAAESFKEEIKIIALDIFANIYEVWRGTMEYGASN